MLASFTQMTFAYGNDSGRNCYLPGIADLFKNQFMKESTKKIAIEIAGEMTDAVNGVVIKRKMKHSIYQIAKKIARKVVRTSKLALKSKGKIASVVHSQEYIDNEVDLKDLKPASSAKKITPFK
jgi:hypothetical protein